jgi:hypothetical protein
MTNKMDKAIQIAAAKAMAALCDVPGYKVIEGTSSFEDGKVNITIDIEETEPQTIYAGTEDNVEFFKQIVEAFGIEDKLYKIRMVDGEWEIIIK